jgi:hypothetical protein
LHPLRTVAIEQGASSLEIEAAIGSSERCTQPGLRIKPLQ